MKTILGRWVMLGAATAILSACAGPQGNGMQATPATSTNYAAIPAGACRISSYPPKGKYVVIANLKASQQPGESATHLLHRLQAQGASMGANYVMVTSVSDKTFLTSKQTEVDDNPYLSQENSFFSTATPQSVQYNHEFDNPSSGVSGYQSVNDMGSSGGGTAQEVVTAKALKITSGSTKPNKAVPSNVWQVNQTQNL